MFLRKGIIKMKKLSEKDMRVVDGGRWKCKQCNAKFWTYVGGSYHEICTGHFKGLKWCW